MISTLSQVLACSPMTHEKITFVSPTFICFLTSDWVTAVFDTFLSKPWGNVLWNLFMASEQSSIASSTFTESAANWPLATFIIASGCFPASSESMHTSSFFLILSWSLASVVYQSLSSSSCCFWLSTFSGLVIFVMSSSIDYKYEGLVPRFSVFLVSELHTLLVSIILYLIQNNTYLGQA